MTDAEKREQARQFYQKWYNKGKEDEDDRSFWLDIIQRILGIEDATDRIEFQKKVVGPDGNVKRIDAYIPETKVLIEQKSLGIDLSKPQSGHEGMTPYQQAKMYDNSLPHSEKARWIILSNFKEIWIYDMDARVPTPEILLLENIRDQYPRLSFIMDSSIKTVDSQEIELSIKAGELVGKIHDRFLEKYSDPMAKRTQNSLNVLCVRLVFCLYAEDALLFGPNGDEFTKYISKYDAGDLRDVLKAFFKMLDTPVEERDEYEKPELLAFPYVNGGLFSNENIIIPQLTEEIKQTIIESSNFYWSTISPTIFGAVFESTLNPETRRSGGMHYTSIENIHKVIDPLFLDDLKAEYEEISNIAVPKIKEDKLKAFQEKLASLKFLDPACGSGNFLTETYVCLRRLENNVISDLHKGQIMLADENSSPIKVNINQFYGIEINDFAVTVAKTALWIAESQMMKETEDVVHMNLDFLPLKTNANIVEGNALQLDWNRVVHKNELNYIMGNPPFVGASMMTKAQKGETVAVIGQNKKLVNSIDYVGGWYYQAAKMMKGTRINAAFVSTNSITQGEQVSPLWDELIKDYSLEITFAYRTFRWDSEALSKANVHCVIIGFSCFHENRNLIIFEDKSILKASNINPYLFDAPNITISSRSTPICNVPKLTKGNQPTDDGNFILTQEERDALIKNDPSVADLIKRYIGGRDFLNNDEIRYCLWLKGVSPSRYSSNREIMRRLQNIQEFRLKSSAEPTRKAANWSYRFFSSPQTDEAYIVIPRVSSQRRRYIPIGYLSPDNIASDSCSIIPGGKMYHFGVLSSNVHMAWVRTVAGRLKSDYRYSGAIVYNCFPWPEPTGEQYDKIEQTAQAILAARALYPDCCLAELYDPLTMPPELRKAHTANDKAVMEAYGLDVGNTSEADCVAFLMKKYQELVEKEQR